MNEDKGAKGGARDRKLSRLFKLIKRKKELKLENEKRSDEIKKEKDKRNNSIKINSKKKYYFNVRAGIDDSKKEKNLESNQKSYLIGDVKIDSDNVDKLGKIEKITIKKHINQEKKQNLDKGLVDKSKAVNEQKDIFKGPILQQIVKEKKANKKFSFKHKNHSKAGLDNDQKDINPKELFLEGKIIDELEKLIKDRKYELNKLITEFNLLNKQSDDIYELKDAEIMANEIDILIAKLEELKMQFEYLLKSYNFDMIYNLDENYISNLLQEYKNNFDNNFEIEILEKNKNKNFYKTIMMRISQFERSTEELKEKLYDTLDDLNIRDEKFLNMKNSITNIDKSVNDLDYILINSNQILKEIENKVNNCKVVTEKVEYIQKQANYNINKLLTVFALTSKNPLIPTNVALLFRAQSVFKFLGSIFNQNVEKRVHYEVNIINYEDEINNALNDFSNIDVLINNTKKSLNELIVNFENNFSEYVDLIPEYKNIYSKLCNMNKYIDEKADYIKRGKIELENQLDYNKEKIKEREYLN